MVRISRSRMDMQDGRIDNSVFKKWGETLIAGAAAIGGAGTANGADGGSGIVIVRYPTP